MAVKKSGEKETTRLVSRSVIHGDLMECRFTPVGGQEIALPKLPLHLHGHRHMVRLDQFAAPGVMLVHQWEGKPIDRRHGGPVRLLVPQLYLWKSAKWLRRIELSARDKPGFWEVRGYHNNGDPWKEERYG